MQRPLVCCGAAYGLPWQVSEKPLPVSPWPHLRKGGKEDGAFVAGKRAHGPRQAASSIRAPAPPAYQGPVYWLL